MKTRHIIAAIVLLFPFLCYAQTQRATIETVHFQSDDSLINANIREIALMVQALGAVPYYDGIGMESRYLTGNQIKYKWLYSIDGSNHDGKTYARFDLMKYKIWTKESGTKGQGIQVVKSYSIWMTDNSEYFKPYKNENN